MERSRQRLALTMGGCGLSFQGDMKEQVGVCLGGDRHMALKSCASSDSRWRFILPMMFSSEDGGNLQNAAGARSGLGGGVGCPTVADSFKA